MREGREGRQEGKKGGGREEGRKGQTVAPPTPDITICFCGASYDDFLTISAPIPTPSRGQYFACFSFLFPDICGYQCLKTSAAGEESLCCFCCMCIHPSLCIIYALLIDCITGILLIFQLERDQETLSFVQIAFLRAQFISSWVSLAIDACANEQTPSPCRQMRIHSLQRFELHRQVASCTRTQESLHQLPNWDQAWGSGCSVRTSFHIPSAWQGVQVCLPAPLQLRASGQH